MNCPVAAALTDLSVKVGYDNASDGVFVVRLEHGARLGRAARGMDPEIASDRVWARHFWHWYDTGEVSAAAINLKLLVGDVAIDDPLTPSLELFEELVRNSVDSEYSVNPAALDDLLASDIIRFHSLTGWLAAPTDSPLATGLVEMAGDGEVVTSSDGAFAGIKSNSPPGGNIAPGVDENGNDR